MPKLELTKEKKAEMIPSLRRYFTENFDEELSDMKAGFLLDYIFAELAPVAYNQGVEDAQQYLLNAAQDLPGTCFQEPMTFWKTSGGGREVRRKPRS